MRRYLGALGHVGLVIILHLVSSFAVALAIASYLGTVHDMAPVAIQAYIETQLALLTATAGVLTLVVYWLLLRSSGRRMGQVISREPPRPRSMLFALIAGAGWSISLNSLLHLSGLHRMFPEHGDLMARLVGEGPFLAVMLTVGIAIPVIEEILYRGIIFGHLETVFPGTCALFLQALIFGLMHGNPLQVAYATVTGLLFGLGYQRFRSIWIPALLHIGMNAVSVFEARVILQFVPSIPRIPTLMLGILLLLPTLYWLWRESGESDHRFR